MFHHTLLFFFSFFHSLLLLSLLGGLSRHGMDGTDVRDICIKELVLQGVEGRVGGREEEGAFAVSREKRRRRQRSRSLSKLEIGWIENRGRAVSLVRKRFQFE